MVFVEYLATVALLLYVALKSRQNPCAVLGCLLMLNIVLEAISINFIESGAFNSELGMMTYRQGITLPLLFNLFVFSYFYFLSISPTRIRDVPVLVKLPKQTKYIFLFVIFVVLFLEFLGLALYGAPILSGGNKVTNARENQISGFVGGSASYVSLCLGLWHRTLRGKSNKLLILFSLHMLVLVLQGQKFTSLVQNLVAFWAISIVYLDKKNINTAKIAAIFAVAAAIGGIFYFIYSKDNQFSRDLGLSPLEAMGYRAFHLVAHTYWGMHYYVTNTYQAIDFGKFFDAARSLVRLMNADPNVEDSLERGTTFGMAFPAYFYFIIPTYIFPLGAMILGYCCGYVVNLLAMGLKRGNFLLALVLFVFMNQVHHIVIQGNFYKIFEPKTFIILFAMMIYFLFKNQGYSGFEKKISPIKSKMNDG
jgi:hypothetical protein